MKHNVRAYAHERTLIAFDHWTRPFWEAAKAGSLTAARCGHCGHFRMPPTPFCPQCQSQQTEWPTLSGYGVVFSYVVCPIPASATADAYTYIPAVVELPDAGGVRLVTNIVGVEPDGVSIGMPLQVDWQPIADGWSVPVFRPV